jgi:hypothetical protein
MIACRTLLAAAARTVWKAQADGLLSFPAAWPHPDELFAVVHGDSHDSFRQRNRRSIDRILHARFTQSTPSYTA